jgi:hypothetical protein
MGSAGADWADAMLAESEFCTAGPSRLRWAWGCLLASLKLSVQPDAAIYPAALLSGLGLMGAYEWSADEGRATVLVLALIALMLGALRPGHALLSGAATGIVVAAVIGFEAATGIRPAYETHAQTLASSLYWTILLIPALPSAWLGARIGRLARPVP